MATSTAEMTVTQVYDCKGPLKDKGRTLRQWHEDVEAQLAQIHQDMAAVAAESRSIEGRTFAPHVYKVRAGLQLRWRFTNSIHSKWSVIELKVADLPPGLAQWYRKAQELTVVLNYREQVLRYELKTVNRLLSGGPLPQVRPLKSTVGRGAGGGRPSKTHHAASGVN